MLPRLLELRWPTILCLCQSWRLPAPALLPVEPILVLSAVPMQPGLVAPSSEHNKAGRMELLALPLTSLKAKFRDPLAAKQLSLGGFDPRGDLAAITVNRWLAGYGRRIQSVSRSRVAHVHHHTSGRKPLGANTTPL